MSRWLVLSVVVLLLAGVAPVLAADDTLIRLLRAQVFNKEFEGFDFYHVSVESDEQHSDGSREVLAVASGKFRENTKRMQVLLLIVGEQVIGGQILEQTDLPPCTSSSQQSTL